MNERNKALAKVSGEGMRSLAKKIEDFIDKKHVGYALIVFGVSEPGISNYISNCQREDMIKALRETADRLERKQDFPTLNAN